MRRTLAYGLVVFTGALSTCSAAAAPELTGPGVIRITDTQRQLTRIDYGRRGSSPGDQEISRYSLYNKAIRRKPIGRGQLVCVNTGQHFRNCTGTYFLPSGKLMVSGSIQYRALYDMAVTGGTGRYNNVHGTLTVTRVRFSPPGDLLVFRLFV